MRGSETVPVWFDESLRGIYDKKRDRSRIRKRDRTLDAIMRAMLKVSPCSYISTKKHSWDDVEMLIEKVNEKVRADSYQPDIVIGIKSGGAFIANYVAQSLGVGMVDYMRTSHYSDKTRSVARSVTQVNKEAIVSEDITVDVLGKKILLVDDQASTGSSLIVAEDYLLGKGAEEVKTFCLFARGKVGVDYFAKRGLAVYFPWGKDA